MGKGLHLSAWDEALRKGVGLGTLRDAAVDWHERHGRGDLAKGRIVFPSLPDDAVLVGQDEGAVVAVGSGWRLLVSDRATTCCILVLYTADVGAAVAHVDSEKSGRETVNMLINELVKRGMKDGAAVDVHLAGGLVCEKTKADHIVGALRLGLQDVAPVYALRLCTLLLLHANTDVDLPLVRGLAVDVTDGEVFEAHVFEQDAETVARHAYRYVQPSKEHHVQLITDASDRVVSPTRHWVIDEDRLEYLTHLAASFNTVPRAQLIKYLSTSPLAEHEEFLREAELAIDMAVEHHKAVMVEEAPSVRCAPGSDAEMIEQASSDARSVASTRGTASAPAGDDASTTAGSASTAAMSAPADFT